DARNQKIVAGYPKRWQRERDRCDERDEHSDEHGERHRDAEIARQHSRRIGAEREENWMRDGDKTAVADDQVEAGGKDHIEANDNDDTIEIFHHCAFTLYFQLPARPARALSRALQYQTELCAAAGEAHWERTQWRETERRREGSLATPTR